MNNKTFLDYPGLQEYHKNLLKEVAALVDKSNEQLKKEILTMSYEKGILTLSDGSAITPPATS